MVTDWMRNVPYSHARPNWQTERQPSDHIQDDGRYYEPAAIRPPPIVRPITCTLKDDVVLTSRQPIDRALREQCQINAQTYFLAVVTDDGTTAYFSGPENLPQEAIPGIFNMRKFLHHQKRAGTCKLTAALSSAA